MTTILLIVHLMIAAAMIGVVLLQRSEGGALGIGGGGGGGFMTGRGAANLLTRVTAGLAAAFFVTSLLLSLAAGRPQQSPSLFGSEPGTTQPAAKKVPEAGKEPVETKAPEQPKSQPKTGGGILEKLETPPAQGGSRLPQSK